MVKRDVYACPVDKNWTVVALYSMSLTKLK